jgi:hypothetical protein
MIFAAVCLSPLSVLLFVIGEIFYAKRPVIVTYAPCPGFSLIDGYFIAVNPHQNDQGRKGPCFFQRLIALKCLKCQKIKKNLILL